MCLAPLITGSLPFCSALFRCKQTKNIANDSRENFGGVFFCGYTLGAGFILSKGRAAGPGKGKKQDSKKLCSGPYLSGCKSTARTKQPFGAGQDNISTPPEHPLYPAQPSPAPPAGAGGERVRMMVLGFPGGGWTRISGSMVVHTVCSLKRSKHAYFWHRTDTDSFNCVSAEHREAS